MNRLLRNIGLYLFQIGFARPILRFIVGLRYRRRNLIPKGPCLVVSNHNSHLDAAILMTLFPLRRVTQVHPVAAADYFGKTWFMRLLAMVFMNAMPIDRKPTKGIDPLAPIVDALQSGKSLIFFPEGSRGKAGVVAPFRAGIGRLVQKLPGLLVVPVFLSGPERIWARGQMVPVPSNIDAVVGKPRTYPSNLEAREIADLVRDDVLALAPPPPPPPAAAPARPVRVAVCGLDSATRHAVYRATVERLGRIQRAVGISENVIEADADGVREITGPIPLARGRAWLGVLPRIFRTRARFKGERFVKMVESAQIDEALGQGSARFLITDGSALVDLLAWGEADFYRDVFDEAGMNHLMQYLAGDKTIPYGRWWRFIRKAPEIWLINVFSLSRPPVPDVLVLAGLPVADVMRHIRARGREWEPYQNETFLGELNDAYAHVGDVLRKRRKVILLEVDMAEGDVEDVAARVEALVLDRIDQAAPDRLVEASE